MLLVYLSTLFKKEPFASTDKKLLRTVELEINKSNKINLNFRIKTDKLVAFLPFSWNLKLIRHRYSLNFELDTLKQLSNLKYLNFFILTYALSTVNWADKKVIQHNVNLVTSSDIHEAIINIFGVMR